MEDVQVQVGIELGSECLETRKERLDSSLSVPTSTAEASSVPVQPSMFVSHTHSSMGIPETSYSSSEDEDFFDASEYMGPQSPTHGM